MREPGQNPVHGMSADGSRAARDAGSTDGAQDDREREACFMSSAQEVEREATAYSLKAGTNRAPRLL